MKTTVRALVLALAVVGFASEHALTAQATATSATPVMNRVACPPVPTCAPNDANGCGIRSWGKGN